MKCYNCKAEWFVNANMSRPIENCPFCGSKLKIDVSNQMKSMADVLIAIIQCSNIDVFRDATKLMSYFCDIAPNMSREKTMLSYFLKCNGNVVLLDAMTKTHSEQIACRETVAQRIITDCLVNDDVAYEICDSFWEAIGGKPLSNVVSEKESGTARTYDDSKDYIVSVVENDVDCKEGLQNTANVSKEVPPVQSISVSTGQSDPPTEGKKYTPDELFQRAIRYEKGYGVPKKTQLALQLYKEAAQQGHIDAMFSLAEMYSVGLDIPRNRHEAFRWYLSAAQKGHTGAMLQVGLCYKAGSGIYQDSAEATKWIRLSALKGNAKAQMVLTGRIQDPYQPIVPTKKASEYESGAKAGDPHAQFHYAQCYALGIGGVSRSYQVAADYYERAAKQGHAEAQFEIAKMYENGLGVMVSLAKAEKYYADAARNSNGTISQKAIEALKSFNSSKLTTQKKAESPLDKIRGLLGLSK